MLPGLSELGRSARFEACRTPSTPEQPTDGVQTHEIGNRTYVVADVDPLDVDGTRTVAVGSVLFLVAFFLLLPFYGRLADAGQHLVAVDLPGRLRARRHRLGLLPPAQQPPAGPRAG